MVSYQSMGNSPSRETPRENGGEGKGESTFSSLEIPSLKLLAKELNALEASINTTLQPESPTPGVKRKRRRSSEEEPRRKKQKSSSTPRRKLVDQLVAGTADGESSENDAAPDAASNIAPNAAPDPATDAATDAAPNATPTIPAQAAGGKLTPISKKRKRQIMACVALPSRLNKVQIHNPVHRKPKSTVASEVEGQASSRVVGADEAHSRQKGHSNFMCDVCGRQFGNAKHLKRHVENPRVHRKSLKCGGCEQAFYQPRELKDHQKESGHQKMAAELEESTGVFTDKEKAKLNRFKSRFCSDYTVSEFDFNTLMTLLGRRGGSDWPNPDVTKAEFREMFYSVLPNRNRKSLNRYRERYFQNVEQDAEWTEEQVKELRELVKERGRKWVEIAERMGRTQDSVYQRWKNRIRQGDAQRFDRWERKEIEALIVAVQECKVLAGLPQDFSSDDQVNWTAVSDQLGKTRNAQQCSSFWKRVYRPKEEAKARGESVKSPTPGRSKAAPAVSTKRPRRRSTKGESPALVRPRRKIFKSPMYVAEFDNEDTGPVQKLRSDRVQSRSRSERLSRKARRGDDPENDAGRIQGAEAEEEEQADGSEDESEGDEADSPTKKPQRDKSTNARTPPSTALGHLPELQPNSRTPVDNSFHAVNNQAQKGSESYDKERSGGFPTDGLVSTQSPTSHETPLLPKFSKRTPRQITSLTQAFDNTQAPTSVRTAGQVTPGMHAVEERPSPSIEVRSHPMRQDSATSEDESDDNENAAEQLKSANPSKPDFTVYDSDDKSANGRLTPQMLSGTTPRLSSDGSAGTVSEAESDPQDLDSEDDQPPQLFTSTPLQVAGEVVGAESEDELSDDESHPPMFTSAAPSEIPAGSAAAESDPETSDDENPPQVFTSVAASGGADTAPATELASEQELETDENDEDEDDEQPPQLFTSALPDPHSTSIHANGDPPSSTTPLPKNPPSNPPSDTSSSSGDAATVYPNGSSDHDSGPRSRSDDDTASEDDSDNGSDSNTDKSMVEATQGDFFANLEASARKVREQRANVGRKVRGRDGEGPLEEREGREERGKPTKKEREGGKGRGKERKGVSDVSSSSSSSEEDE